VGGRRKDLFNGEKRHSLCSKAKGVVDTINFFPRMKSNRASKKKGSLVSPGGDDRLSNRRGKKNFTELRGKDDRPPGGGGEILIKKP